MLFIKATTEEGKILLPLFPPSTLNPHPYFSPPETFSATLATKRCISFLSVSLTGTVSPARGGKTATGRIGEVEE